MFDPEKALWLTELIVQAISSLDESPGVIIEVDHDETRWLQLFPENSDESTLSGFAVNFPYRGRAGEPVQALLVESVPLPPNTRPVGWEDDGFATIWIGPDIPVVALAHLAGDILERIVGAPQNPEISVLIEFGF